MRAQRRRANHCSAASKSTLPMRFSSSLILLLIALVNPCFADDRVAFHITARPWAPLNVSREQYLDSIEGVARFMSHHLGDDGEVFDPLLKREHQYSTPYFAFAVGTLAHAGRA